MARAGRTVGVTGLVVVLAAGAYVTADAYDLVPGLVTLAPATTPAAPFPVAPGAVLPASSTAVLASLDPAAPTPDATQIQALVDAVTADPRLGASAGAVVTDQLTGEVLGEHGADAARQPASTAKLVTAVAALEQLGGDHTVATRVVDGGGDRIVLVGGGDMMLAAGAGDPTLVNGRAGLGDLATQVAQRLVLAGRTTVTLALDDTLFTGSTTGPWDPADVAAGYAAPVTSVAVDIGAMKSGEYPPRYADPAMHAATELAARLTELGITVTGAPTRVTSPATGEELGSVVSAPLSEVAAYFLDMSDNTVTEVVSRLVALDLGLPASFEGGTAAVLRVVQQLGVDIAGVHLADASGLGDGSALTPRFLMGLLSLVTDPAHPALREVATGMPIGGLTGTLSQRFTSGPGAGTVRAKTGSLKNVTSLAGTVLDSDGRLLLFVVMADQTGAIGQWNPRAAIDSFVGQLAGCGCRA